MDDERRNPAAPAATRRAAGKSAVRATVVPPESGGKPRLAARAGNADLAKDGGKPAFGAKPAPGRPGGAMASQARERD